MSQNLPASPGPTLPIPVRACYNPVQLSDAQDFLHDNGFLVSEATMAAALLLLSLHH